MLAIVGHDHTDGTTGDAFREDDEDDPAELRPPPEGALIPVRTT
jgi:hypothetical protein